MIWIDSSFAVEWLLGSERAAGHDLRRRMSILPAQFAEVCAFFLRRDETFSPDVLSPLDLVLPEASELCEGARLWLGARRRSSKASLADATLSAVVRARGGVLLSFDGDFQFLGFLQSSDGQWVPVEGD